MSFTIHNFAWDHLPSLLALMGAAPGDPQHDFAQDEQFARKWLQQPGYRLDRDCFLAFMDGRAVGYSRVEPEHPIGRAIISGAVHPDYRGLGLGRQLLSRAMAHARGLGLRYAHVPTAPRDVVVRRLLTHQGFAPVRVEWHMRREGGATPPQRLPPGYTLRHFRAGEEWLLTILQNGAFAGNWGFCPNTVEQVARRVWLPGSSPEGVLLLMHGEEPAGYCWTRVNASPERGMGVIWMMGLLPQHRGKGLGRVIVVAGLRYLAGLGLSTVDLTVDRDNVAARRLYTSLGFQQLHETRWYEAIL